MPTRPDRADTLAGQLLEAQVRHHLDRLSGDRLAITVGELSTALLDASRAHQIDDLVDRDAITTIVTRSLRTVPASAAVGGLVELALEVLEEGPEHPYPLGDLVPREQVEALVDELLRLSPVLERGLERLTASPLVGTMSSRFMGRIVGEVLQANKAIADRVPGLGSLMSFGTSAASRVMGAADKQLEGLIGDTVGRGGTFAVRRLNRILIETLQDPTTRAAVLEVWDLVAAEPVVGLGEHVGREELAPVADAVHDLVISLLGSEHLVALVDAVVDAFFDRFGGFTPAELLAELELSRDDLVADLVRIAPAAVEALRASGELERLVRAQIEPFYLSAEVRGLLG